MRRFAFAAPQATAFAMAMAVLAPIAAPAQTVEDYRTSLREAPVTDATAPLAADLCRPLMNFVYVELRDADRSQPWYSGLSGLFGAKASEDASLDAKRATCLTVREQPVISFTNADNELIVTPPQPHDPGSDLRAW